MKELRIECPLDQQYADLYQAAIRIAAGYLEQVNTAIKTNEDRTLFTHLLISVRIKTNASWSAMWCKKVRVKDTDSSKKIAGIFRKNNGVSPGQSYTLELPKGPSHTYPAATFNSLPAEIRNIALHHERLLGTIRKIALENRRLKKSTYYSIQRAQQAIKQSDESLTAASELALLAKHMIENGSSAGA